MLDHWNMSTMVWLRYVVYERWRSVAGVFFFSAIWHGFYAGYYLTFLGAALVLETSRLVSLNFYFSPNVHTCAHTLAACSMGYLVPRV